MGSTSLKIIVNYFTSTKVMCTQFNKVKWYQKIATRTILPSNSLSNHF